MHRQYRSDQGKIWHELAAKAAALEVASPTEAMGDVFAARALEVAAYREALPIDSGQVGALVYGAGVWWGLDVLGSPSLFRRAWGRLLAGYAMDAVGLREDQTIREEPIWRLSTLLDSRTEVFPGVGLGDDHRFRGRRLLGSALVADQTVAHLMAFPA
jgi:hypothetical protein